MNGDWIKDNSLYSEVRKVEISVLVGIVVVACCAYAIGWYNGRNVGRYEGSYATTYTWTEMLRDSDKGADNIVTLHIKVIEDEVS